MKPNRLFKLLAWSYGISTFSEGLIMPIYAVFVQRIGGDILDASGAVATFLIVCGVATIIIQRFEWSEKHRVMLMIVGWLVWLVGIASYFLISTTFMLFVTQVLVALGNAIADPALDAELDDHTDDAIKSYEWGLFDGLQDIFNGIAALIGGAVVSFFGFGTLITVMVCVATISFMIVMYYVKIKDRPSPQRLDR